MLRRVALHDGSEYRGDYGLSRRQLIDWHRPRLEALLEAEPDLIACETVPCLDEAEALARLLEEYGRPAWLSFSCRDDERLCHGETFVEAVRLADQAAAIVAVGVNCTAPWHVEGLLQRGAEATRKTLLAYPNSGEGWNAGTGEWTRGERGFAWSEGVRRWLDAGAGWIGGCCRTTPATIRETAGVIAG
ncbi:MAG: homocysteine S-methyltransferase family protein [Gemmataceae bacterium]